MVGNWTIPVLASILILGGFGFTQQSFAAPTFYGPTPYLSAADIPAGFYASGAPTALEDFEDHSLDFGITFISTAPSISINAGIFADSVDADDGVIDGDNTPGVSPPGHAIMNHELAAGHAMFIGGAFPGPESITFTFPFPVPEAGLVWTDSSTGGTQIFEAFGPGMISLGMIGPFSLPDVPETGETAEDRFFGVTDPAGIIAIKMTDTNPLFYFEVDHIQYGSFLIVGGTSIPIDQSALLLAGVQSISMWMIPVLIAGIGIGVFVIKRRQ